MNKNRLTNDPWSVALAVTATLMALTWWMSGGFVSRAAPDTSGYRLVASSSSIWGQARHPLYGFVVEAVGAGNVAIIQFLLHIVACFALFAGIKRAGMGSAAAFALAFSALVSQAMLLTVSLQIPEAPAASLLIVATALTIASAAPNTRMIYWIVPIALCAGVGYLLRPSFLPAIFGLPVLRFILAFRNRAPRPILSSVALCIALASPFIVQSAIRWNAVGHFNVVSFSGIAMAPMAQFMLTPEIVGRLPDEVRPTAVELLAAREAAERSGRVAPTPINSSGQRSFVLAALGYFDIYARNFGDLLPSVLATQRPDESWVAFNRRMERFSWATLRSAPVEWLAWIAGATKRFVGHAVVLNGLMLLATLAAFALCVTLWMRKRPLGEAAEDLMPVCIVASIWLAMTGVLTVMITFPVARYIDTAAMLLPAVPILFAISAAQAWLKPRKPSPQL